MGIRHSVPDADAALYAACESGDFDAVVRSLDEGADVNQVYDQVHERQLTPLEAASWRGQNISVVRMLLDRGASVNGGWRARVSGWTGRREREYSLLHGVKDPQIMELLLERGADPRSRDSNGWTPLDYACRRNSICMVQMLLRHGARTYRTSDKNSALYTACGSDSAPLVRLLLDAGADIEGGTTDGRTPLVMACKHPPRLHALQVLCERGADVNVQDSLPMWFAIYYDKPKVVEILLAHGAYVDPPSCFHGNKDSRGLLGLACRGCIHGPQIVRMLLDHGAPIERKYDMYTPLKMCVSLSQDLEIAGLLLSRGAAFEEALAHVRRGIQCGASRGTAADQNWRYGPINALFDCFLVPHYLLCARLYVAGHRSNHPTSARHRIFADPFLSRLVVAFLVGPSVCSPGGERAALVEWKAKLASLRREVRRELGRGPPPEDY